MVNAPSAVVVGRDITPEVGHVVYEIIGGAGNDPSEDGLQYGLVAGRVTKVIQRLASKSEFSPTLSCFVQWDGSKEGPQMKKTGLGGCYDLILCSSRPRSHEHTLASAEPVRPLKDDEDKKPIPTEVGSAFPRPAFVELPQTPKKEKESGFELGSPGMAPTNMKHKKTGPAPLWKPGSFTLKKTPTTCTEIDEFNITKSKKELDIEAQREMRQLSRGTSGSESQLFLLDSAGRTNSSGSLALSRTDSNLKASSQLERGEPTKRASSSYLKRSDSKNNVEQNGLKSARGEGKA